MPQRLCSNTSSIPDAGDIAEHQAKTTLLIANKNIMTAAAAGDVAPVEELWNTTPFSGDFNPGTKLGNSIFLEKTKGLSEADCLDPNKANLLAIHKVFRNRERIMGDVISKIPTQFNADGTVKSTAELLTQYHHITLENVQCADIAEYNVTLAIADPNPPSLISMRTLDPGNNGNDERQFYKEGLQQRCCTPDQENSLGHRIRRLASSAGTFFVLQRRNWQDEI